nr:sodium-dependent transporter [Cellulosilyticum ruminicola]
MWSKWWSSFILIYLVFLALLGLPILTCEFAIGRGSRRSVASAFDQLEHPGTNWHRMKWFGIIGNTVLMMFYTMVAGWMFCYAYRMATGQLTGMSQEAIGDVFTRMLASPGEMVWWTLVTIVVAMCICSLGLKNGVERITKVMMSLLIVIMIILAINSLTLSDSSKGVAFYLVPDFRKLVENGIGNVVFAAMSHAFFTLSVGMGSMEIFGSYLESKRKLTGEALSVVILDTFVALTAGLIIIPACYIEPNAGPPLLFITLPNVFNHMEGGRVWGTLFFVFMTFAALSTVVAVFENIVSMTMEMTDWGRKKTVMIDLVVITVLSMPAIFGYNILSFIEPMGSGSTIMDLEDFIVSYNILPLGSLIMVLFCVKKNGWGFESFIKEADTGKGISYPQVLRGYMQYGLPTIIVVVYLKGYYDMFAPLGVGSLVFWMIVALLFLGFIFSLALPQGHKKK